MSTADETRPRSSPRTGLSDTSPEAQRVFDEVHRGMPEWRKWEMVEGLYQFARQLHAAGVELRHPGAGPREVRDDWMTIQPRVFPAEAKGAAVIQPPELRRVVLEVVHSFRAIDVACVLGGSVASSIHGIPRSTLDADVVVEPFPGKEERLVAHFGAEYYVSLDAVKSAVRDRTSFNIISTYTGLKIDVFVRKDRPFEKLVVARRVTVSPPVAAEEPVEVVSPEDIVLLKLEWYRMGGEASDRQWSDVLNVLRVRGAGLDRDYLAHWAAELGVRDLLDEALAEAGG